MAQPAHDLSEDEVAPIDVRQAVHAAMQYVKNLYQDTELPNLRLEEVEMTPDGRLWLVTIGFTASEQVQERDTGGLFGGMLTPTTTATTMKRDYKLIEVDATTGLPLRMKIRKV